MAEGFQSLAYLSFLTPYEPQRFIDSQYDPAALAVTYNVPLMVLGLGCYLVAAVIFAKRDLPGAAVGQAFRPDTKPDPLAQPLAYEWQTGMSAPLSGWKA